jgi:general secretion pathway protein K
VIVLWSLGMLALLGAQLTAATRVQLRLAAQARDQAMAEAAADGATRQAIFILLGGGRIGPASQPVRIRVGEVNVAITAEDEATKINPNAASRDVLRGLLLAVGVDQPRAALLANEIADWRLRDPESVMGGLKIDQYREHGLPYRSADLPFYSVDEIGLIPDMTPEILARLRPGLSVFHEGGVSDTRRPTSAETGQGLVVMRLTAAAVIPGRARFVRSATVRIRADTRAAEGDLIQILAWE